MFRLYEIVFFDRVEEVVSCFGDVIEVFNVDVVREFGFDWVEWGEYFFEMGFLGGFLWRKSSFFEMYLVEKFWVFVVGSILGCGELLVKWFVVVRFDYVRIRGGVLILEFWCGIFVCCLFCGCVWLNLCFIVGFNEGWWYSVEDKWWVFVMCNVVFGFGVYGFCWGFVSCMR